MRLFVRSNFNCASKLTVPAAGNQLCWNHEIAIGITATIAFILEEEYELALIITRNQPIGRRVSQLENCWARLVFVDPSRLASGCGRSGLCDGQDGLRGYAESRQGAD